MIGLVALIEIAPGQDRDTPGPEIIRSNVVGGCGCALVDRQNLAIGPGVKRITTRAGQERNICAHGCAFDPGNRAHGCQRLFRESIARPEIGILRFG